MYVAEGKAAFATLGPRLAQIYGQGESPMTITAMNRALLADAIARGDDARIGSVGVAQTGIEIRIAGFDQGHVHITCDGQTNLAPEPQVRVLVRKAPRPARLLHPQGHDHYAILRAKLGWGGHLPVPDEGQSPVFPAIGAC